MIQVRTTTLGEDITLIKLECCYIFLWYHVSCLEPFTTTDMVPPPSHDALPVVPFSNVEAKGVPVFLLPFTTREQLLSRGLRFLSGLPLPLLKEYSRDVVHIR